MCCWIPLARLLFIPVTVVGSTPESIAGLPGCNVKLPPMLAGGAALDHGVLPAGSDGALVNSGSA